MFGRLFRKKENEHLLHTHNTFNSLHKTLQTSFSNIKRDMGLINSWTDHFKERHVEHDTRFEYLFKKLEKIEQRLDSSESVSQSYSEPNQESYNEPVEEVEPMETPDSMWDLLTPTQQKICWKLASLHKEMPGQWIPLKYLAQEMYPEKEYSKIRSAISQFVSNLEKSGYVKRKRRGKQAYVMLIKDDINKKQSQLLARIFSR